jgi:hypothetical protein
MKSGITNVTDGLFSRLRESEMTALTKRRFTDAAVFLTTFCALFYAGAGLWALLIVPYGWWNFYDGATRK